MCAAIPMLFALLLVILPAQTDHPEPELLLLFLFTVAVVPLLVILLALAIICCVLLARPEPTPTQAGFGRAVMAISLMIGCISAAVVLVAQAVAPYLPFALLAWMIVVVVVEISFFRARRLARSAATS
jgi:hypothetical protein